MSQGFDSICMRNISSETSTQEGTHSAEKRARLVVECKESSLVPSKRSGGI